MPAIDGWFTLDDEPRLIGTRCTRSGTYFFPPESTMSRAPGNADSELVPVELSRTGTVWSFTNAGYQPPEPYIPTSDPYVPFAIAAVELAEEQIVILGQVADGYGIDDLSVGAEVELVLEPLYEQDGVDHLIYRWKPVSSAFPGFADPGVIP